jgi:hopene-associated glycosyltransferase HpnB
MLVAGGVSLAAWLAVLARSDRPWDLRPIAEDEALPPGPDAWPAVAVVVPARNESGLLPATLPALLAQDYRGPWHVVVVDDRSEDGTAELVRALGAGRVEVVDGTPLPDDWVGKVWALEQGRRAAGTRPEYLLFTDADVHHAPASLSHLVTDAEVRGLALTSRMARLRCVTASEKLLIPAFVLFFNLLYPMRRVNDSGSRVAAAAGGCVLVRRTALEAIGGLGAIAGELIDDVNLARRIKAPGRSIRLAVSREEVRSLRRYGTIAAVWRMVRRTAFDELRYSWLLLAGTLLGLAVLFVVPPALVVAGIVGPRLALGLGLGSWAAMTAVYLPAVRLYGLRRPWVLAFPLAGILFGGMTLDSALRHARGLSGRW